MLDPACGSGNFLYIALRALLDLEKQVIDYAAEQGWYGMTPLVSPSQMAGIELDHYAAELAKTALWIGYIQWHEMNGFRYRRDPILTPLDTIRQMDAILDHDGDGNVVEPEWPDAEFIVGNPPFLGGKLLRTQLGDGYIDRLFNLYDGRVSAEADIVCYWFEKARAKIESGRCGRAGLLATQGIRGGANRRVLERIKASGDIFMAYSDHPWVLEGAAVHVSLVGFDNGEEDERELDGTLVSTVHSNLTSGVDLTIANRLRENRGIAFMGDTKGGPFDIPEHLALLMLGHPNPNGRSNDGVVRPWVNGLDINRRRRNMWIIDFGTDMAVEEAALYEAPFEYVKEKVKPARLNNKRRLYAEKWWLHMESRPGMRNALQGLSRYIGTSQISRHRIFSYIDGDVIPDHTIIVFARDDDYTFGILHSRIHEKWALRMGTQLETRPRYTSTTCFETFPFPRPTDEQREAIAAAARELNRLREGWLNPVDAEGEPVVFGVDLRRRTLTNLYNEYERHTWLVNVHERLDAAVAAMLTGGMRICRTSRCWSGCWR